MFEIRYDDYKIKQLQRQLRDFGKNALPQVMSRGLNRTATGARTKTARMLSRASGIKVGDARKRLFLQRASYRLWRSSITVSRKRLSLKYLLPRGTKRGLSVKSPVGRVKIKGAFFALGGWFIRLPASGGYKQTLGVEQALQVDPMAKVGRLPIGRIRGPILAQVYAGAQEQANRIHIESLRQLEKNIHDQVQLILRRRLPA